MPRVLCFGGPLNEKVVGIPADMSVLRAPVLERVSYSLTEPPDPVGPAFRDVLYDIEKVGFDGGGWQKVWRVAVARGFPRQYIIDAMNAILVLCTLPICAAKEAGR